MQIICGLKNLNVLPLGRWEFRGHCKCPATVGADFHVSIHATFAANLRGKCFEHGTIADICRGIGINRQQFNKYLAGTSIPNAVTLRKICGFLEIDEHTLFSAASGPQTGMQTNNYFTRQSPLGLYALSNKNLDLEIPDLPCGNYICYFPLQAVPGVLVRSLLVVYQNGRQKEFIRLTRFPATEGSSKLLMRGRHKGVVFASLNQIHLLGFNRYSPFQCSLMTLTTADTTSSGFFRGMIMTHGMDGPLSTKLIVLATNSAASLKDTVGKLGIIHESQAGLNSVMISTLSDGRR